MVKVEERSAPTPVGHRGISTELLPKASAYGGRNRQSVDDIPVNLMENQYIDSTKRRIARYARQQPEPWLYSVAGLGRVGCW
jgi:hypothetical protein